MGSASDPNGAEPKKKRWLTNEVLFEECQRVWTVLSQGAAVREGDLLWEGTLGKVFTGRMHLYSPVMKLMYETGCLYLANRGGGRKQSIVKLLKPPKLEEIIAARREEFFFERDTLTKAAREKVIEQMVNDMRLEIIQLRDRVERLEKR
jgi:hypothetical protein